MDLVMQNIVSIGAFTLDYGLDLGLVHLCGNCESLFELLCRPNRKNSSVHIGAVHIQLGCRSPVLMVWRPGCFLFLSSSHYLNLVNFEQ